jgi:quercetin dioxygenase-like cupin family protein
VEKDRKKLNMGDSFLVAAGMAHRFYNEADKNVKFHITSEPGHTVMENFGFIFTSVAHYSCSC